MTPHPRTLASIKLQPLERFQWWECGCNEDHHGRWHLCAYHQGFDDACEETP